MITVIEHWEPIVCIGGPAHGKSYPGHDRPKLQVGYSDTLWEALSKNQFPTSAPHICSLAYERFLVEVKLPGLRLNGYVWKWEKLNDEDCVKAALGLVLASAILTDADGVKPDDNHRQDRRLTHEVGDALRLPG